MKRAELYDEVTKLARRRGWQTLDAPPFVILVRDSPAGCLALDVRSEREGSSRDGRRFTEGFEAVNDRLRLGWPAAMGPPPFTFAVVRPSDLPTLRAVLT